MPLSVPAASGVEIAYKELTTAPGDASNVNATTSFVAVTGLDGLVVPIGSRPVKLRYGADVSNNTASRGVWLAIYDETNAIVPGSATRFDTSGANGQGYLGGEKRLPAPTAQHTYHIRLAASVSGTATISINSSQYAWFEAVWR